MEFEEFSKKAVKQIDKELSQLLREWRREVENTNTLLLPLVDRFIAGCKGGKRIRGLLVVLGYEIGSNVILSETKDLSRMRDTSNELRDSSLIVQNDIYKVAAAYEIFHSAILIHDDVIDQSLKRRGQPSLYKAIGNGHYGVSQAISLGDAGFFLGFKIISGADFPKGSKIKALELFSKVMLDTALGEILDLEKADPLVVTPLKTAYYTISGPLQLGAILGGGKQNLIRVFGEFGKSLGIAFQIRDDILDSEVDSWGGIEQAEKAAEKFRNKAMKILPVISKDPKMSKILEQMAESLVKRNK